MVIVRWEPARELVPFEDRFNRLFNQTLSPFFGEEGLRTWTWTPPVDIYETQDHVVIKAELPGVDPKDVEVRVENGTLYLQGQRKFENEVKDENYHRIERSYGSFVRNFPLPSSVDSDKATAQYKDGVLTLTMPKREEAKPKAIKIRASKN